jgi:hypothetical protein
MFGTLSSVLSFLDQKTAVCCAIDQDGKIVFKNKSWELFVLENHYPPTPFRFPKSEENYFKASQGPPKANQDSKGEPFEVSTPPAAVQRFLSSVREALNDNSFDAGSRPLKPLFSFPPGSHFVAPRIRDKKELHEYDTSTDHEKKNDAEYSKLIFAPSRSSSASESGSPSDPSSPRPTVEPEQGAPTTKKTLDPHMSSSSPESPLSPLAGSVQASERKHEKQPEADKHALAASPLLIKTTLNLKYNVTNSHLTAKLKLGVKKLLIDKSWLAEDQAIEHEKKDQKAGSACFLILEHKLVRLKKHKQVTPSAILPLKSVTELEEFFKIVDTFSCHCCLIDLSGKIIYTNPAWNIFCMENGGQPHYYLGHNYLQLGAKKAKPPAGCGPGGKEEEEDLLGELMGELEDGFGFMEGLKRIVDGHTLQEFQLIYPCHSPRELRFFLACGFGLFIGGERYIFVSHELISKGEKDANGEKERDKVKEWQQSGEREKRKRDFAQQREQAKQPQLQQPEEDNTEIWKKYEDVDDIEAAMATERKRTKSS